MPLSKNVLHTSSRMGRARSYADGYRYCSRCRAFYLTNSIRCPYCGIPLRMAPRKRKGREPPKAVVVAEDILMEAEEVRVRTGV